MIHALHLGLNYRSTGSQLSLCVADARALESIFGGRLHTGKQSREHLLSAIPDCVRSAGPDDWIVLTYSGHGTQVEDQDGDEPDHWDEAMCTHERDDTLDVITDDEFRGLLHGRNRKAKVLAIMDSCFSGTMHRAAPVLSGRYAKQIRQRQMRYVPPALVPARRRKRIQNAAVQAALPNVIVMSGCTDFEFSYEGREHGVLTGALIETYSPKLTIGQWWARVLEVVEAGEYGGVQHPQIACSRAALKWRAPSL